MEEFVILIDSQPENCELRKESLAISQDRAAFAQCMPPCRLKLRQALPLRGASE
jgi:hypothetical protein